MRPLSGIDCMMSCIQEAVSRHLPPFVSRAGLEISVVTRACHGAREAAGLITIRITGAAYPGGKLGSN